MKVFRVPVFINVLADSHLAATKHVETELIWLGLQGDNRICDSHFIPDMAVVEINAANSEGGDTD